MMFVSLEQASDHLRRDTDDDDSDLILKIKAASIAVLNAIRKEQPFLDSGGLPILDSNGVAENIPEPLKSATLIILGLLYADRDGEDFRDGDTSPRLGDIVIPRTAHFLIDPYRRPLCL